MTQPDDYVTLPPMRRKEVEAMLTWKAAMAKEGWQVTPVDAAAAFKLEAALEEPGEVRREYRVVSDLPAEQPDMANISGRSEAGDKPPITAHTEQPDTEGGDAHAESQAGDRARVPGRHVAEGAAVDDGRALDQCPTCGSGDRFRLKPPCREDPNVESGRLIHEQEGLDQFSIHLEQGGPRNDVGTPGPDLREELPDRVLPLLPEGDFHVVSEAVLDDHEGDES